MPTNTTTKLPSGKPPPTKETKPTNTTTATKGKAHSYKSFRRSDRSNSPTYQDILKGFTTPKLTKAPTTSVTTATNPSTTCTTNTTTVHGNTNLEATNWSIPSKTAPHRQTTITTNPPTTNHNFYSDLANLDDTEDNDITDTITIDITGTPPTTTTGFSSHNDNSPRNHDDNFEKDLNLVDTDDLNIYNTITLNTAGAPPITTKGFSSNYNNLSHKYDDNVDDFFDTYEAKEGPNNKDNNITNYKLTEHTPPLTSKTGFPNSTTNHTLNDRTRPPTTGFYGTSNIPPQPTTYTTGPRDNNNDFPYNSTAINTRDNSHTNTATTHTLTDHTHKLTNINTTGFERPINNNSPYNSPYHNTTTTTHATTTTFFQSDFADEEHIVTPTRHKLKHNQDFHTIADEYNNNNTITNRFPSTFQPHHLPQPKRPPNITPRHNPYQQDDTTMSITHNEPNGNTIDLSHDYDDDDDDDDTYNNNNNPYDIEEDQPDKDQPSQDTTDSNEDYNLTQESEPLLQTTDIAQPTSLHVRTHPQNPNDTPQITESNIISETTEKRNIGFNEDLEIQSRLITEGRVFNHDRAKQRKCMIIKLTINTNANTKEPPTYKGIEQVIYSLISNANLDKPIDIVAIFNYADPIPTK
jgi:hypothetical protein